MAVYTSRLMTIGGFLRHGTRKRTERVRLFVIMLLIVLAPGLARAQGFNAVFSRDGADVWAVGPSGSAWRSVDSGGSWSTATLGGEGLNDVTARGFLVWVVGDSGRVHRSLNSGGSWSTETVPGGADLRAIAMPGDLVGFAVGGNGAIFKTVDGGATWAPQASGTVARLRGVHFSDLNTGWVVGDGGTLLSTVNGGGLWSPAATGVTHDLLAVDAAGSAIWAVGRQGTALRSLNGGADWTPVNLRIDSRADVTGVDVAPSHAVTLVGGGGFIRRSADNGNSWIFRRHTLQAPVSDFVLAGPAGFVVNRKNRGVLRSLDSGVTWNLVPGVVPTRTWTHVRPLTGNVRGSTINVHGTHPNTLYAFIAGILMKSENRGDTWVTLNTVTGVSKVNAFYVSPADSLLMLAAVNTPDRIIRSVNGGLNWSTIITKDFTEYGIPVEVNVNDPDELLFAPEDGWIYRSQNFGLTWSALSFPDFRSPCDVVIDPDSSNIVWVGDGVTNDGLGVMHRSTDGGLTFTPVYATTGSEIPMIAGSRHQNSVGFSTHWNKGGVRRTTDYGATWDSVAATSASWGVSIAQDDPNCVIYGVSAGGLAYLSFDQGNTFTSFALNHFNYSLTALDRNTMLAEQGNGIHKLNVSYSDPTLSAAPSLVVVSPNGGEQIVAGSGHTIRWTAVNVPLVRIEYRPTPADPWELVARTDGYPGHYLWSVPVEPTLSGRIRVLDDWDGNPIDSSNATFQIVAPSSEAPETGRPPGLALRFNRPNPFAATTRIHYALPAAARVRLEVFTVDGRLVATLVDGEQGAGEHSADFGESATTASGGRVGALKSGVYFARLAAGTESRTIRMLLVR